jgi:subtilisin family serine protease
MGYRSLQFHLVLGIASFLLAVSSSHAVSGPSNGAADIDGQWLIKIAPGLDAIKVASSLGAEYIEPLEGVDGYHRVRFFEELVQRPDELPLADAVNEQLSARSEITAFEQVRMITSYPRLFEPQDPRFPDQWHLENIGQSGGVPFSDARVRPAWDQGLSGQGVTIAIVDEGIQFRHPDLEPNWWVGSGYDYNDDDSDPSPSGNTDRHGTAVAGISLAASNTTGVVGIAHNARLVPLRLIAGPYDLGEEAEALSYRKQDIDIYNNSWGPSDDFGVRYADSSSTLKDVLRDNTVNGLGRGGLGNIYVWAAGNGGLNGDNSNYDGYNSLPYTISVGAVGHDDIKAGYSEPGANLLVVAPSGGRGRGILTTDNTGFSGYSDGDEYENFSGTSAASPMVAGVVGLLLEARPDLNWRDVQQILALTASPIDFSNEDWQQNGAGYWVNHDYGFGRVDAAAAIELARDWPSLGTLLSASGQELIQQSLVTNIAKLGSITINQSFEVQFVRVTLRLHHGDWGDIRVELESPSGTRSELALPHANANSSGQPGTWTYLSTRHLGEASNGLWRLRVTDEGTGGSGSWVNWSIELMGHDAGSRDNAFPEAETLAVSSTAFPVEIDALSGITDPDGDPLEVLAVQHPRAGNLASLGEGRFAFTMGETKDGRDTFSILVGDGKGGVVRRMVRVLDPRPVGANDLYTIATGTTVDLPVLSNDRGPVHPLRRAPGSDRRGPLAVFPHR